MFLKKQGYNFLKNTLFIGTDKDEQCANMAYIQLSLLCLPAVIVHGNPLTKESFWQRETYGCMLGKKNEKRN